MSLHLLGIESNLFINAELECENVNVEMIQKSLIKPEYMNKKQKEIEKIFFCILRNTG